MRSRRAERNEAERGPLKPSEEAAHHGLPKADRDLLSASGQVSATRYGETEIACPPGERRVGGVTSIVRSVSFASLEVASRRAQRDLRPLGRERQREATALDPRVAGVGVHQLDDRRSALTVGALGGP